ncbi:MAG: branched-chain amino acid ABC transporter permease [Spirochaetales bacterium]|jgi:branched-subunit amino acid ABC-type transport system permease component|nr:branched-chain amino acid ABC transporter permease [Spirochaetales bacterium]
MGVTAYISIILNGMLTGGVYGLFSSAFTFQAGALNFANFSYGAFIMLSMYLTYYTIAVWHLPVAAAVALILLINAAFGILLRKTVLKTGNFGTQILCTMGISMIVINGVSFFCSSYPRDLAILEKRLFLHPEISIGLIQLGCFGLAAAILLGFHLFLTKTWQGIAIRAVVQNREIAAVFGINTSHILDLAFSLSCCLIGVSGIMLMVMFPVTPVFGDYLQNLAFIVCISAGLGNMWGAFFSGIFIGVVPSLIMAILGARFQDPLLYLLFVLILLIRPYGIFTKNKNVVRAF